MPKLIKINAGWKDENMELATEEEDLLFENGELSRLLVDGGYVTFTNGTPHYHFHLKDHLGSSRVVFSETGAVEQETQYYPYGGIMADLSTGQDAQRHKYNGKELDRMHGLDWYDYGARHYDAIIGRWTTMDPLCEKYYNVSPYAYCVNNPVKYIDENGDSTRVYIETNQLGHTWLSVGEGKDMVVYSYGRYNGTYKGNRISNGDGVLLRLTDEKAKKYMDKKEKEGNMSTFVISDVKDSDVKTYIDNIFCSSSTLIGDKSKEYYNDPSAHMIDSYELLSNNCTTFVSDVLNNIGSNALNISRKISSSPTSSLGMYYIEAKDRFVNPRSLLHHLNNQSHKPNSYVYKR